jgi:hypothetical protein
MVSNITRFKGTSRDILAVVRRGRYDPSTNRDLANFGIEPAIGTTLLHMGNVALQLLPQAVAGAQEFELPLPQTFAGDEFAGADDILLLARRSDVGLLSIMVDDVRSEELTIMQKTINRCARGLEEMTRAVIVQAAGGLHIAEELEPTRIACAGAIFVPLQNVTPAQAIETLGLYSPA